MSTMVLALILASLVSASANSAIALEETSGVFHVAGKVMCQDCYKSYNDWVNGDRPIKGCKVSLTCMDERKRVMYYTSDVTDELGKYDMVVSKYVNGKVLKEKLCFVRLVSSPDPSCNVFTDFGRGKSGVKLRQPTSVYRDMVQYMLPSFYFTTSMCKQPDTTDAHNY